MKRSCFDDTTLNACPALRSSPRAGLLGLLVAAMTACAAPATGPHPSAEASRRRPTSATLQPSSTASPKVPVTQRDAAGRAAGAEAVVIVAGGDVNLGRVVGQRILESADYAPLAAIAPLLRDADLRFVNLESQLSDQQGETQSPRHRLIFTGPPQGARTLALSGIHVVSTANNHAWDYGRSALFETLEHLRAAGVRSAGTGRDLEQAYRPALLRAKGLSVALFALTDVWNQGPIEKHEGREYVAWASFAKLRPALLKARAENDLVLVSYHGGAEYQEAPSDVTRGFVKAVIEAGADAVIGHHPHVIQGVGWVSGRPVFYSLGNLVFDSRATHPWTRYGMLARLEIGPGAVRNFAICPYRLDDFVPVALERAESDPERIRFLTHLRKASTAAGGIELGASDSRGCVPVFPAKARSLLPGPLRAGRAVRPLAWR